MLGLGEPWRGAARARLRRSSWAGAVALLQVACSVKFLGAEAVLSAACVLGPKTGLECYLELRHSSSPRRHRHRCWNDREPLLAEKEAYLSCRLGGWERPSSSIISATS